MARKIDKARLINQLINSADFRKLIKVSQQWEDEKSKFDILSLFNEIIDENALCRLLGYLFNSFNIHGLEDKFFWQFIKAKSESPKVATFMKRCSLFKPISTETNLEYGTEERRRIDILIQVLDTNRRTKAVVGIETKIDSGEQVGQVSDYQKSLVKEFPKIPKLLIFLTPYSKLASTGIELKECPHVSYSFKEISSACDQLISEASGQARVFLSILQSHLNNRINYNSMDEKVKSTIHKLYQNEEYRQALKLIAQSVPNINNVFTGLIDYYNDTDKLKSVLPFKDPGTINTFTYASNEFKMKVGELDHMFSKHEFGVCYMLKFDGKTPDIDDPFTFRLMLHCPTLFRRSRREKNEIINKVLAIAEIQGSKARKKHWYHWINIWVGNSYRLVDLGIKDVKGLRELLCDSINATYPDILTRINKINSSPKLLK